MLVIVIIVSRIDPIQVVFNSETFSVVIVVASDLKCSGVDTIFIFIVVWVGADRDFI